MNPVQISRIYLALSNDYYGWSNYDAQQKNAALVRQARLAGLLNIPNPSRTNIPNPALTFLPAVTALPRATEEMSVEVPGLESMESSIETQPFEFGDLDLQIQALESNYNIPDTMSLPNIRSQAQTIPINMGQAQLANQPAPVNNPLNGPPHHENRRTANVHLGQVWKNPLQATIKKNQILGNVGARKEEIDEVEMQIRGEERRYRQQYEDYELFGVNHQSPLIQQMRWKGTIQQKQNLPKDIPQPNMYQRLSDTALTSSSTMERGDPFEKDYTIYNYPKCKFFFHFFHFLFLEICLFLIFMLIKLKKIIDSMFRQMNYPFTSVSPNNPKLLTKPKPMFPHNSPISLKFDNYEQNLQKKMYNPTQRIQMTQTQLEQELI